MKIDAREIAALTQAQPAAPRMDMYASIHKALRAFMTDTLLGLGRILLGRRTGLGGPLLGLDRPLLGLGRPAQGEGRGQGQAQ